MKRILFALFLLGSELTNAQDTLKLSLLFTGDIMQHESQIVAAFNPESGRYEYKPCFEFIKPILSAPDLTIGNLELTLGGPPYKGYPQFSAPDELLDALRDAGFDVLVTANNHSVDRGQKGLERTVNKLDSMSLLHTGTFKDTLDWLNDYPLILSSKGFRLSLLNYTYGTNGLPVRPPGMVNRIDPRRIASDLQKAKDQHTDAIIVFMHWGLEYQLMPTDEQRSLANLCFQHGAKMVIGSHPHVPQPIEWNKEQDQLVIFSLGNFVSAQRDRYRNGGVMLHVDLEKIIKPDSSTSVTLKNVAYSLEYVHRQQNGRGTYVLLPISQFENDSTFRRSAAWETLIQFRDDARSHLQKENKNVGERQISTDITKDR